MIVLCCRCKKPVPLDPGGLRLMVQGSVALHEECSRIAHEAALRGLGEWPEEPPPDEPVYRVIGYRPDGTSRLITCGLGLTGAEVKQAAARASGLYSMVVIEEDE